MFDRFLRNTAIGGNHFSCTIQTEGPKSAPFTSSEQATIDQYYGLDTIELYLSSMN